MADEKITDLSDGSALQATDELVIARSGGNNKISGQRLMPNIGSSPPSSPVDGDIWIYPADSTNGVNWMFVYNSAETTYKWRFVGGAPLLVNGSPNAVINALTQVGATGNYYQAASMAYTLARAGDYDVEFGGRFNLNGASSPQWIALSAFHGSSAGTAWFLSSVSSPPNGGESTWGFERLTAISASVVVGVCANAQTAGTVKITDAYVKVRPIRII